MGRPHFAGTETNVLAIREIAHAFDPEVRATNDIGADQVSRRTSAGAFVITDADGSLPHRVFVELIGPGHQGPVFPDDDAKITIEDVEFPDIPRAPVPDLLRSVHVGMTHVKARSSRPAGR
ncbi:hypothetical protein [Streptomyces sp. NBC_00842]|uniref:hypothetical protein n=1 Tax=unclassified Streptomyces TaxID=2593676 RepID=UPI00386D8F41